MSTAPPSPATHVPMTLTSFAVRSQERHVGTGAKGPGGTQIAPPLSASASVTVST